MAKLGYDEYFAKKSKTSGVFLKKYKRIVFIMVLVAIFGAVSFFSYKYYKDVTGQKTGEINPIKSLFVDDKLSVYRFKLSQWMQLGGSFEIFQKDWFVTGAIPRTILTLSKDNNIRVAPISEMIYLSCEGEKHALQLNQGKAFLETFDGRYVVYSPLGSIFMEAGKALIDFDGKGTMKVACFSGKVSVVSNRIDSSAVSLLPGEKVSIGKDRKISAISKINKKELEKDKWIAWNLAFSGKGMKVGQEPPAFTFAAKKEEVQMVFRQTEDRIKVMQEIEKGAEKNPEPVERKPESYPKFEQGNKNKIPAAERKKAMKTPEKRPSIPEDNIKKGNPGEPGEPAAEPDKPSGKIVVENKNEFNYEAYQKDEMDRKHKGAYYYIDNEKRSKENPVSVPGYKLNSDPIGPSEK